MSDIYSVNSINGFTCDINHKTILNNTPPDIRECSIATLSKTSLDVHTKLHFSNDMIRLGTLPSPTVGGSNENGSVAHLKSVCHLLKG